MITEKLFAEIGFLKDQNEQLKQQLEELKKDSLALAEFYGDKDNYFSSDFGESRRFNEIDSNDLDWQDTAFEYGEARCGGKRARQFLAKYRRIT